MMQPSLARMVVFVRVEERAQIRKLITMIVVGETTATIFRRVATTIITPAIPAVDTQTGAIIIIIAVGVIQVVEPVLPGIHLDPAPAAHLAGVDSPVVAVVVLVAGVVVIHAEGTNLKIFFV